MAKQKPSTNGKKNFSCKISIPYFGNPSHKFGCNLAKLLKKFLRRKFDINLAISYKTASYFQIDVIHPTAFVFNVVCKFTCFVMQPCNTVV